MNNANETNLLPKFDASTLLEHIKQCSNEELDQLDFGVIGFDLAGNVCRYNAIESQLAALADSTVLGRNLFGVVAPCMNNFMVAQRFEDALAREQGLDEVIDYVLTFRMRPQRVKLRLLAQPGVETRYVLVQRNC